MHSPRSTFAIAILVAACAHQPRLSTSAYGLPVVDRVDVHAELVRLQPEKALVDLKAMIPTITLDIRYATPENFMKRPLYPEPLAMLRCPAALALRAAHEELMLRGIGLKVFDAYRPYSVTVAMWEPIRDPDYVADPARGSRHNRGAAVDVTLIELESGAELQMPTDYDDFTPRAAHAFTDLPPEALRNRALLRQVMERHGFSALSSEWWHYDFTGWENFEVLDLPHSVLQKSAHLGEC